MLNAPWWVMPGTMFLVNAWIKSRANGDKLYMMNTEEEVKALPVIVAVGKAEKAKALPAAPGGFRWKEIVLTYSVSPFSAPSEARINVLEKWLNDAPHPSQGAGYMSHYDTLQGFQWAGQVSPGAGAFLTAEYLKPGASPRGASSPLGVLVPREQVLYMPTTAPDFGALGHKGGGGGHHHGGGRGGRGWGGGWGPGWGWGPLYAEDLPMIVVEGSGEPTLTQEEVEEIKKKRAAAKKKAAALSSFAHADALSCGTQFGQGPDDIDFRPMSVMESMYPNTYETDWKSFAGMGDTIKSVWASMKDELAAKGLRLTQIPVNQAVVGDFVVTADCKLCTIQANHAQGGLVLREIHPKKGQLWHYMPGHDHPFACAFGIRR